MDLNWNLLIGCSAGIVGFIEWIKSFDKEKKLKKLYNILPLILAIGIGVPSSMLIVKSFDVLAWIVYSFILLALSTLGYKSIIKYVTRKIESLK